MMRALDLDLVRRRPAWPAWAMLAVGVLLAAEAGFGVVGLRDEVRQLEQRRAAPVVRSAAPAAPLSEPTRRELDAARRVLQELTLPWEAMFRAIEEADGKGIALLSIEPDAAKRSVRIGGEARNYPAILAFMQRLEASHTLSGVHLLNHQLREQEAGRPVYFIVATSWGAAP
jgi:Fimbrial assembly protein (PilN)